MGLFDFLHKKDPRDYIPPVPVEKSLLMIKVSVVSTDERLHFSLVGSDGKTLINPMTTDPRLLLLGMTILERMVVDPSWVQVAKFSILDANVWSIRAAENRGKNDPMPYQHALEELVGLKNDLQNERDRDVQ